MCGILGIFNDLQARLKADQATALLSRRGKDACGVATTDYLTHADSFQKLSITTGPHVLMHSLHAIVDNVAQPLRKKGGVLAANCEIYNWKFLKEKYESTAKNDAELLLDLLDKNGLTIIDELDGVFAFVYWHNDTVILARDILGEKPLWYSFTTDSFAVASEKKILEAAGFASITELNPRQILTYDITSKNIAITNRAFFSHSPVLSDAFESIQTKLNSLLDSAIENRVPKKKFGLLLSGGVDSTLLAAYFKSKGYDVTAYTAVLEDGPKASDLEFAIAAAKALDIPLKIARIPMTSIPKYLETIVPLIEDSNVVKVGVALTFFAACELAKQDGCKVIFSGLGSEEIFAGYERHLQSADVNKECVFGLMKMYERDLYRDDCVTMFHGLELRLPFLDHELIKYSLRIPAEFKIKDGIGKYILRSIAEGRGVPKEIAWRKKVAAQYGSRFDYAIEKLANRAKQTKSEYTRQFYPSHNLKLGVLFSGGKDSTFAAYIMQRQNYEISCLITLRSKNQDSFMFHTPAIELTSLQAEAMNIPLLTHETEGVEGKEIDDLKTAIAKAKDTYKIQGVVTGALFSTYQRDRIEKVCDELGLKMFAPLWHKPQSRQMQELFDAKFKFILTGVAAEGLDASWLGRPITLEDLRKLEALEKKYGINVAGEGGEFESLVVDCPLFSKEVILDKSEVVKSGIAARLTDIVAHVQQKTA